MGHQIVLHPPPAAEPDPPLPAVDDPLRLLPPGWLAGHVDDMVRSAFVGGFVAGLVCGGVAGCAAALSVLARVP